MHLKNLEDNFGDLKEEQLGSDRSFEHVPQYFLDKCSNLFGKVLQCFG